jgi:TetR/AcrR family transcriptional repressor of nem operon
MVRRVAVKGARAQGRRTRERIVADAAELFSTRGYFGSSISDVLEATGLRKGGFYNHFASKEHLALEAFEYSVSLVEHRFVTALGGIGGAVNRLLAIAGVIRSLVDVPVLPGGCPILTTAIEADDTMPALRDRAREAMTRWQRMIGREVRDGIETGELRPTVDPYEVATIITATLEGAVFLSKLYGDAGPMRLAVDHVGEYVRELAA